MARFNGIIWDFNGTIIDDVEVSLTVINQMLAKRNLPCLTLERYREVFTFPVKNYYLEIGFDFQTESWDQVAHEYINLYWACFSNGVNVFNGMRNVFNALSRSGVNQVVLSAMEQGKLEQTVSSLGLDGFFNGVFGIEDHLADGKVHRGHQAMIALGVDPSGVCLVGDTVHDTHVAQSLGVKSILVATGHQNKTKLLASGSETVHDHKELFDILFS